MLQFRLHWTLPPTRDDREFLEQLRRLDSIPVEMLENPAVMEHALPVLRANAALYRSYVYEPGEPFSFPIVAYGGSADPNVRTEPIAARREQTSGPFARRELAG